ncbi:hypothetical protein [Olivibacter domesticus]|uniref:Uncharacterized protein n=1 Tax=Olivibacter domesticus TaxID=407022 RepID=A0A1H7YIX4_OLID1|nr:hypothetical protein [Olivibacter domesticus]SEM46050.1 hypothetical protein SAMN05661044_05252 [Olivibacter domesticus]
MKTNQSPTNPMHFRYLNEEAIQNPLIFIEEFCHNITSIELFRQDLLTLFQAACTRKIDNNGKYYLNPSDYVFDYKQSIHVIEALWAFFHQSPQDLTLSETHPYYQKSQWKKDRIDIESRLASPVKHFRKLENAEINNIMFFLQDLFNYRDLSEWREVLDDMLYYAHAEEGLGYGSEICSELIPIMDYLEKIAEAIFLIADITISKQEQNNPFLLANYTSTIQRVSKEPEHSTPPNMIGDYSEQCLDDDNFTEGLVQYLTTYWHHLEVSASTPTYGPVMLSEELEKEIITYFETFHPKFLTRNFRRIYLHSVEHIFTNGTPYYHDELLNFTYQMDALFDLLELAEEETQHWPQENRLN